MVGKRQEIEGNDRKGIKTVKKKRKNIEMKNMGKNCRNK